MSDNAARSAEFAAVITAGLTGRPPAAPAGEIPAAPPTSRLPAPNMAQGTSGVAAPVTPISTFEDAVRAAIYGTPPGGWHQVRP